MISNKSNNKTFMQTIKSITLKDVCSQSKDYLTSFFKRRPIVASLLMLELGSWTYLGLKRFAKSFIWWNTVLELELKGDYTMKPKDPFDELFNPESRNRLSFINLLHTIIAAGKDKRVKALFIRLESEFIIGIGQIEELRRTLKEFKIKYNKKIIIYADNLATYGMNAVKHYYIASIADRIYMSQDGIVNIGPVTIDYPFVNKGLKDKLHIEVEVRRRAQYKSAGNMFTRDKFDKYHKEQYEDLIKNLELNWIDTVAKSRLLRPYSKPKNPDIIKKIGWIVGEILNRETDLEFKLDSDVKDNENKLFTHIKEEKSDELDANYKNDIDNKYEDEWKNKLMYLVHSWSCNYPLPNYKQPKLFVVLQFYHKVAKTKVFYQAIVTYPAHKKGKFQNGGNGIMNDEEKIDSDGNVLSKDLKYKILPSFQPGPCCVELVKPGDIVCPKDDRKIDEDFNRGNIRDGLIKQYIVILRNVNDILHNGAYTSAEALTLGLIDGLKSYSEVYDEIPTILDIPKKKVSYLYIHRYYQRIFKSKLNSKGIPNIPNPKENPNSWNVMKYFSTSSVKIAYIGATNGAIIDGNSSKDKIGSVTLCRQLRAARKKKSIKGVILHLDTPGGSATACHNITCEINELIKCGKKIVAVQANVAASGGYYLSAPCSYILSQPSTITGSIGIIAIKLKTKQFWKDKLGINYDRVTTNKLAASQFSMLDGIGDYERIRMEQLLTLFYKRFKTVIAKPRDMTMDNVEKLAKGQVFLGSQALETGLVDDIGGLYEAMAKIKELCDIPSYKNIKLVNPLGTMSLWDILIGRQPEHENDFSTPRTHFNIINSMINFINPVTLIKYSGISNLLLSNIVSSPFISSILWMKNNNNNLLMNNGMDVMGMMNNGNRNRISNDLKFVADQLQFYQNNSILMHSSSLSYLHYNILRNGQI